MGFQSTQFHVKKSDGTERRLSPVTCRCLKTCLRTSAEISGGSQAAESGGGKTCLGVSIVQEPWNQKVEKWSHGLGKSSISAGTSG